MTINQNILFLLLGLSIGLLLNKSEEFSINELFTTPTDLEKYLVCKSSLIDKELQEGVADRICFEEFAKTEPTWGVLTGRLASPEGKNFAYPTIRNKSDSFVSLETITVSYTSKSTGEKTESYKFECGLVVIPPYGRSDDVICSLPEGDRPENSNFSNSDYDHNWSIGSALAIGLSPKDFE